MSIRKRHYCKGHRLRAIAIAWKLILDAIWMVLLFSTATHSLAVEVARKGRTHQPIAEKLWMGEGAAQIGATLQAIPPTLSGSTDPQSVQLWLARWVGPNASEYWITEATHLIAKYQVNAPRASRVLAYVAVAMNDASILAARKGLKGAGQQAAVHAAASGAVAHFFPNESDGRLETLGASALSAIAYAYPSERDGVAAGMALGQAVVARLKDRTLNDGADEVWDVRDRPSFPGVWQATPPMDAAHPQEPLAGRWRTWSELRGGNNPGLIPPRPSSGAWLTFAKEVLAVSMKLTPQQRQIAHAWHLDQGTVTPAGIWNQKALELTRRARMNESSRIALMALMNVAIADATIACWRVKYMHWVRRPITLIREHLEPTFSPLLVTPMHPSYPSGHACASGAAAEVMKAHLPSDSKSLDGWAHEAALSRLYGGIHFRIDNEDGLKLGRWVAKQLLSSSPTESR